MVHHCNIAQSDNHFMSYSQPYTTIKTLVPVVCQEIKTAVMTVCVIVCDYISVMLQNEHKTAQLGKNQVRVQLWRQI